MPLGADAGFESQPDFDLRSKRDSEGFMEAPKFGRIRSTSNFSLKLMNQLAANTAHIEHGIESSGKDDFKSEFFDDVSGVGFIPS